MKKLIFFIFLTSQLASTLDYSITYQIYWEWCKVGERSCNPTYGWTKMEGLGDRPTGLKWQAGEWDSKEQKFKLWK